MGNERGIGALALVGSPLMNDVRMEMPASPDREYLDRLATDEEFRFRELDRIPDPTAREYFLQLAGDHARQTEIYRYHEEVILPAILAGRERFMRALGDNLHIVRLDRPQVIGYEYRDSPDLIYPHVRSFLDELDAGAGPR